MMSSKSFVILLAASLGFGSANAASAQEQSAPLPAGQQQAAPSLDELVAPPGKTPELEKTVEELAFESAMDGAMPLKPEQIQQLISRMSEMQRITAPSLLDPERPRPELKVETVSLDPGVQPPIIKVAAGYVTTVMMMDATGAPWDIVDVAYAGKFEVKTAQANPHVFRITPLNRFYEGNLTVQLKGLATPLTFRLSASNDVVYYRYDVRVPALGPNAKPPRFASATNLVAGDSVMTAVLDGYPPSGAKRLKVSGLDDRTAAWEVDGQIYLRTPHSLLSPAWSSSASSGDGTTVYSIQDTPVLLLSDGGLMVRARVTRPEGITDGDAQIVSGDAR